MLVRGTECGSIVLEVEDLSLQVKVLINDRIDVALATDADGVHVGQDDIPAAVARRLLGESKILGVSVKTVEQAQSAEKAGADYLGAGASKTFSGNGNVCLRCSE